MAISKNWLAQEGTVSPWICKVPKCQTLSIQKIRKYEHTWPCDAWMPTRQRQNLRIQNSLHPCSCAGTGHDRWRVLGGCEASLGALKCRAVKCWSICVSYHQKCHVVFLSKLLGLRGTNRPVVAVPLCGLYTFSAYSVFQALD